MYHWLTVAQAVTVAQALNTWQMLCLLLNSSFCQFIEYQDAHATLSTESTDYILNSVCNFSTFGKELPLGSAFLVFSKYYFYL